MTIALGNEVAKDLCGIFGVKIEEVTRVTIVAAAGDAARITFEKIITEEKWTQVKAIVSPRASLFSEEKRDDVTR